MLHSIRSPDFVDILPFAGEFFVNIVSLVRVNAQLRTET
jgi:hypothetical protein